MMRGQARSSLVIIGVENLMISKVVPVLVPGHVSSPSCCPGTVAPRNGHSGCYRYLAVALAMDVALKRGWLAIAGSVLRMELDSMTRVIYLRTGA